MRHYESFLKFCERVGSSDVKQDTFDSVFDELTDRKPIGEGFDAPDALDLLVDWYKSGARYEKRPLNIIESFKRPRVWAMFLAWEHARKARKRARS